MALAAARSADTDEIVPLAIWPCAQITGQQQRAGRYVPESTRHPGKMLPELARRVVLAYSRPRDLVVDPMCGVGTTLVEAAALGRRCIGVDLEQRWVNVTRANVQNALTPAQQRSAKVVRGDARALSEVLPEARGRVALVVVSPPYACEAGVIDKRAWLSGHRLCDAVTLNYSYDSANLGYARGDSYRDAMTQVYAQCFTLLRRGGLLVTITKNMRQRARLVDLASVTVQAASGVGFGYLQHNVALHAAVRDGDLVARPSFWQLDQTRRGRDAGIPLHLIAHEDVLAFIKNGRRRRG